MQITIREMLPKDWDSVGKIYNQGIEGGIATFERTLPSFAQWDAAHLPCGRLVARAEGEIIGFAALSAVSERECYAGVAEVSVYVDNRFKNRGAGYALLCELINVSERHGFWTLQSTIIQQNAASIHIHEKGGFRVVGYREGIAKDRAGRWTNTVLMERRSKEV